MTSASAFEVVSEGTEISTARIGSSSTGSHLANPSFKASAVAIRNAISELSTLWNWPSNRVTLTSTTGKPSGPRRM